MKIVKTTLDGCLLFQPDRFNDKRGFFQETFRLNTYQEAGITEQLVQDNWSRSEKGVLRGMHFQRNNPQGKLVSVLRGEIFDVAVDIRPGSQTFAKWFGVTLSEENRMQIWLPPGFAHGFLVLSDVADVVYKTSAYYEPLATGCFAWNDTSIAINWPANPKILSDTDNKAGQFKDLKL